MPDFGRWNGGGDPSLNDINRSDQFLDALAAQRPVYSTDREDADLANLLAGWRDDVRETPSNHVLTMADAERALGQSTSPRRVRRLSLAVVGSAAAAVLCLGGFGAVIAGSGPGDALYGLKTTLFGDSVQTRDDAVALAAQTEMEQVAQLIQQGDWQGAQSKLQAVTTTVATVDDDARKQQLVSQWQELTVKVEQQNPTATVPPGAPLPTFPQVVLPSTDSTAPSTSTSPTAPSGSTTPSTSPEPSPSDGAPSPTPSSLLPEPSPSTTAPSATLTTSSAAVPSPSTAPSTAPSPRPSSAAPSSAAPSSSAGPSASAVPSSPVTSSSVTAQSSTVSAPSVSAVAPSATGGRPSPSLSVTTVVPAPVVISPPAVGQVPAFGQSPAFDQPSGIVGPTTTTFPAPPGLQLPGLSGRGITLP